MRVKFILMIILILLVFTSIGFASVVDCNDPNFLNAIKNGDDKGATIKTKEIISKRPFGGNVVRQKEKIPCKDLLSSISGYDGNDISNSKFDMMTTKEGKQITAGSATYYPNYVSHVRCGCYPRGWQQGQYTFPAKRGYVSQILCEYVGEDSFGYAECTILYPKTVYARQYDNAHNGEVLIPDVVRARIETALCNNWQERTVCPDGTVCSIDSNTGKVRCIVDTRQQNLYNDRAMPLPVSERPALSNNIINQENCFDLGSPSAIVN